MTRRLKRYILLDEDGTVRIQKTAPEYTDDLHGWCELRPTKKNIATLSGWLREVRE